MEKYIHPKAQTHGALEQLFDDVFFVTGSFLMKSSLPLSFSRNMVILRQGDELTLVNSIRLNEEGLKQLDVLGKVTHIVRLAAFHGSDDPFYKDRYGATVWSVDAPYSRGLDKNPSEDKIYLKPDQILDNELSPPVPNSQFIVLNSATPSEAFLLLQEHDGILIAGDCLQNWQKTDRYFNWVARIMMRFMGFIRAYNIGPAWLKGTKPDVTEIQSLLDLEFENLLPAHGTAIIGEAKALYKPAIRNCKQY